MALGRKTGGGSRKGSPNKATAEARAVFTQFVEAKAARAQELWERVAEHDPAKALELLVKLAEFVIPKLARTEVTGEASGPVKELLEVRFVNWTPPDK